MILNFSKNHIVITIFTITIVSQIVTAQDNTESINLNSTTAEISNSAESTGEEANDTQTNNADYIGVYHQASYDSSTLPAPGHPMQLVVQLFNTKEMNLPLRTMANIDGRLIELTPSRVYLNKDDYPEYIIETHAPHAFIEYYFIAYGPNDIVATSEKFIIRRPCLPDINLTSAGLSTESRDGQSRLTEIVRKAWNFEKEIKTYEHAHKIIEAINLELNRLDGKS
jgi:hypothetical protein